MSLIDVIYSFATGSAEPVPLKYAVARQAVGTTTLGRYTPGATTTSLITACIQPTNGRDLQVLLEAGITEESKKVFTDSPLLTRRPGAEPDVLTIDGESWVVHNVSRWEAFGETFWISLVARKSLS
jgi:hypothetical protein